MIEIPNGLLGIANNVTPLIEQLKIRKMKKLRELADEKGFFVLEGELSKNTKDYDYLYMCLLRKWLRDEHRIHIKVDVYAAPDVCTIYYFAKILARPYRSWKNIDGMFRTYKEALQEALTLALNEIE